MAFLHLNLSKEARMLIGIPKEIKNNETEEFFVLDKYKDVKLTKKQKELVEYLITNEKIKIF